MMTRRESTTTITIALAAQQVGLSRRTVRRYIQRGLVNEALTEGDLAELRRIRRLTDLGVNLDGVEIILRMRCQIQELQGQVEQLAAQILHAPSTPSGMSEKWQRLLPVDQRSQRTETLRREGEQRLSRFLTR